MLSVQLKKTLNNIRKGCIVLAEVGDGANSADDQDHAGTDGLDEGQDGLGAVLELQHAFLFVLLLLLLDGQLTGASHGSLLLL